MSTYLKSLLASQELTLAQQSELETHKQEVESFLRQEFGQAPMIKIAGSVSKGTANSNSYDLDLVTYFPSSDSRTLKEIYDEANKKLVQKYAVEQRSSALRIQGISANASNHDYHIDVVPGKFIEGTKDVFLHITDPDRERIQTNLKTHINYITQSGCQDIIRLVKIWKVANNLTFRTFALELFVIDVLRGHQNKSDLESSFTKVMEAMASGMKAELVDPANSANIVSRLVQSSEKALIISRAQEVMGTIKNHGSEDKWKQIFKMPEIATVSKSDTAARSFVPHTPWSAPHADR